MTYQTHPTFGVTESFLGPAGYANAQYIQRATNAPAQSMSVGDSATKDTIEGFEKIVRKQKGVTTVGIGAAEYVNAQTIQKWDDDVKGIHEEEEEDEEDDD